MNDTKLKFTISYDISSTEYSKLVNLLGANFVLVPIMGYIDAHTYKNITTGSQYDFRDLFGTWGSSFNTDLFANATPEWNYGSGVNSGTNTISYETGYGQYLKNTTSLNLATSIKFGVYKATISGGVATPTGDLLTSIDYSDLVNVSCTFTEVE